MRVARRWAAIPALLAAAVAIVVVFADREEPRLTGHPGFQAYRQYCRRCHGYSGEGKRASRMAERPVSLVSPAFRDTTTLDDVERVVGRGKGKMEGYGGKLTPEEIEAVSRYVLDLPPSVPEGGSPAPGGSR